jgi:hypothetical protein
MFRSSIAAWIEKANRNQEHIARYVCTELAVRVVMRTPVDTGYARSNWQPGIGAPNVGTQEIRDPTGGAAASKAAMVAAQIQIGDTFYLSNNVAYIQNLEYGHSKQAPAGMVRLTLLEADEIAAAAVRAIGV